MQMPSSVAPSPRAARMASSGAPRRTSRGGRKAPTPGSTRQREARIVAGSQVISTSAPRCRSARTRLPMLPTPASITVASVTVMR